MSDSDTDQTGAITPTPAEREALRAAIAKATPGPWRVVSEDEDRYSVGALTAQDRIRFVAEECREFADAHAIALAVNLAGPLDAALTAETARADAAEAAADRAVRERDGWMRSAAEFARNADFYRDLLHGCAAVLGDGVRQQDDGRMIPEGEVLALRVPELVVAMAAELAAIRATARDSSTRLVAAAEQAVKDGLLISTLRAEVEAQEARAVALSRTLLDVLRHGVGLPESIANDVRAALGGAR